MILSKDHVADNKYYFSYYDYKTASWRKLPRFSTLPDRATLIVGNGILYAVGGVRFVEHRGQGYCSSCDIYHDEDYVTRWSLKSSCAFKRYDARLNCWLQLPSMKKARDAAFLVYADGCIYVIGGWISRKECLQRTLGGTITFTEGNEHVNSVDRYDMRKKVWENIGELPKGVCWSSAVAFQGHLLIFGMDGLSIKEPSSRKCRHVIAMYNPDTDAWDTKLNEQHPGKNVRCADSKDAKLFVHEDKCYRVLYQAAGSDQSNDSPMVTATVNSLMFKQLRNGTTAVRLGEAVSQDNIPVNGVGAFRIQDKVFVNANKLVYKTDLRINPDDCTDVNLGNLVRLQSASLQNNSNAVVFTIDRNKVMHPQ